MNRPNCETMAVEGLQKRGQELYRQKKYEQALECFNAVSYLQKPNRPYSSFPRLLYLEIGIVLLRLTIELQLTQSLAICRLLLRMEDV